MEKRKSIEDLVSSIYKLVNEAKEEFENIKKKELGQPVFSKRKQIEENLDQDLKVSPNQNPSIEQITLKNTTKRSTDCKSIDFNQNKIKTSETASITNKIIEPEDYKIKKRFEFLFKIWIEKNLKRLIELEFSNYIKVRND